MGRRGHGVVLAVVAGVVAGLLPGAAAGAAPTAGDSAAVVRDGLSQPVYSYARAVRETVYVEIPFDRDRDGRRDRVAADIVRPSEPAAAGRRVPVILEASPYYRCCARGNESEFKTYGPDGEPTGFPLFYDNYFVPRGYAVVLVDLPGTARSTGCLDVSGRSEILGTKTVIDWLNGRARGYAADGAPVRATWATGDVGMIGKSWDGATANGVAATGVAGLRTVVPIAGVSDFYTYMRWNGLVRYEDDIFNLVTIDADYPEPGVPEDPCLAEGRRLDARADDRTGNYNAFWAERDFQRSASRVRASVFLVHGLNDLAVPMDQLAPWWAALGRQGVRRKLWLTQVGHVDPFDVRRAVWVRTLHRWFDSELYGVRNGITTEPPVTREARPGVFVEEHAWPAPSAAAVTLPLTAGPASGADRLGGEPAPASVRRAFTDDPEQTEQQLVATPGVRSAHRLAFVSAPLPRAVRLSGTPVVTLRASVDRRTTPLTALLVDYGPASRINADIDSSGIRTLDTESCWGRSTPADDGCYRDTAEVVVRSDLAVLSRGLFEAKHRLSADREDFLTPGVDYTLRWPLHPQDVVVGAGHRLAVVIAASFPDLSLPEPTNSATVSVRLRGSSITLPVVGGAAVLG